MSFGWGPTATGDRFQFSEVDHTRLKNCGTSYIESLSLIGIKDFILPVNLVGGDFLFDAGNTSRATAHEVAALRAGRALHVTRTTDLSYVTDCCDFWAPNAGVYARVGSTHDARATLKIRLTRR